MKSPSIGKRAQFHLAYSHQYAQWNGGVAGGLTDFSSCESPLCFLDHDQRNTLATGVTFGTYSKPNRNYSVNFNTRLKVSYVTGAHAFAVGLQTISGYRDERDWRKNPGPGLRSLRDPKRKDKPERLLLEDRRLTSSSRSTI